MGVSERACTEQSERGAARIPYPLRVQQPNSEVGVAGIPYPDGDALTFGLKGRSEKKAFPIQCPAVLA
jgi:hypothetical protein